MIVEYRICERVWVHFLAIHLSYCSFSLLELTFDGDLLSYICTLHSWSCRYIAYAYQCLMLMNGFRLPSLVVLCWSALYSYICKTLCVCGYVCVWVFVCVCVCACCLCLSMPCAYEWFWVSLPCYALLFSYAYAYAHAYSYKWLVILSVYLSWVCPLLMCMPRSQHSLAALPFALLLLLAVHLLLILRCLLVAFAFPLLLLCFPNYATSNVLYDQW